jgi:hypothetical protein
MARKKIERPPSVMRVDDVDLFDKVAEDVFHGHRALFDGLTKVEREMVIRWLTEAALTGKAENAVSDVLWEIDYERKPVDIETFLTDEYYLGHVCENLHPKWFDDLKAVFSPTSTIVQWIFCLAGDTRIPLMDGTEATLQELHREQRKPFWVYSISPEGQVVPGKCTKVTRFAKDRLYKVTLDDGSTFRANADHEMVCRDGVKRKLRDLKPGDRLMPFTTRMEGGRLRGYERVYIPQTQKYAYTHRVAGRYAAGGECPVVLDGDRAVAHHVDFNKRNNVPENIRWMAWAAHKELHRKAGRDGKSPEFLAYISERQSAACKDLDSPIRKGHLRFMQSKRGRALSRRNLLKAGVTREERVARLVRATEVRWDDPQQREMAAVRCRERSKGNTWGALKRDESISVDDIYAAHSTADTLGAMYANLGASRNRVVRVLRDAGLTVADLKSGYRNHRIESIEPDGYEHVYCLTVPEHGNFAICTGEGRQGVFSGNTGAIGTGKTTVSMAAMAYVLHLVSCLRDPASYYGLLPDSLIVFGIYSITKRQVSDTGYLKMRGYVDSSPYYRFDFPRSRRIDSRIDFTPTTGKNIQVIGGCVAEGTLVNTVSSAIPIEGLASRVKETGTKICLDLWTENGYKLTCSLNHRIVVELPDGTTEKRRAEEIKVGDRVLTLSPDADVPQLLRGEWASSGAVQGLREGDCQRTLPCDEDVCGQEVASDRPAEVVSALQIDQASIRFCAADGEVEVGTEDVPEGVVQTVREWLGVGEIPRGCVVPLPCAGEGPRAAMRSEVESGGSQTVEAVLRGEAGCDIGAHCIARRTFQAKPTVTGVARREPGQGYRGEQACVCEVVEGVDPGAREQIREVVEGAGDATRGTPSQEGDEEVITGHAYFRGHRTHNGVVWTHVLLLWSRPLPGHCYVGPRDSVDGGGRDRSVQHGAVLSELQFQQEQHAVAGLDCGAVGPEPVRHLEEGVCLCASRVVRVQDAGVRRTYDVMHVGSDSHTVITNGIVSSNSQELHALGLDLYTFCMDEVNFMRAKQDKTTGAMVGQAHELYTATYDRIVSRFVRPGGSIPGLMMLMSSRKAETSFLEEKIKNSDSARTYISDYSLWEVKPTTRFIMPHFRVEIGDKIHAPRLLEPKQKARPEAKVVSVPGEFRATFVEDIDRAIRDVAGLATHNVSPYLRDRASLLDAVRERLFHPFTREEITLDVRNEVLIDDYFQTRRVTTVKRSRPVPKLNPVRPRVIHIDLALTGDCAGIAMGHISGMVRRTRLNAADGTYSEESMPFIIIDFMLRIRPPAGSEIDLSKVRAFVVFLSRMYPILRTTFDGYQSKDSMQILNKLGVEAGLCSVDKADGPYTSLRSALFDRRMAYYRYQPVMDEIADLEIDWNTLKVDHPIKSSVGGRGSKDVSDALAGVVAGLMDDERAMAMATMMDDVAMEALARTTVVDPTPLEMEKKRAAVVKTARRTYDLSELRENV